MAACIRRFLVLLRKNAMQIIRTPGYLIAELIIFALIVLSQSAMIGLKQSAESSRSPSMADDHLSYHPMSHGRPTFYDDTEALHDGYKTIRAATGEDVSEEEFELWRKEVEKKTNLTVVEEKDYDSMLHEMSSGEHRSYQQCMAGLHVTRLNHQTGQFSYEMLLDQKSSNSKLGNGWQKQPDDFFEDKNFAWLQQKIDEGFFEATKTQNQTKKTLKEVSPVTLKFAGKVSKGIMGLLLLQGKNILVIVMIIFTVRGILHDKEHMMDFMAVMGVSEGVFYTSHATILLIKQILLVTPIVVLDFFLSQNLSLVMFLIVSMVEFFVVVAFSIFVSSLVKSTAVATFVAIVGFFGLSISGVFMMAAPYEGHYTLLYLLNPWAAEATFFDTVMTTMERGESYSFVDMFKWKDFLYPGALSLGFMFIDILLIFALTAVVLKSKAFSFNCRRGVSNEDRKELFSGAEEDVDLSEAEVDIEISHLSKVYKNGFRAVDDLNMTALRGQVTVLLGHNGAGKTTTFSMICGSEKPSDGSLTICGERAGSSRANSHIGYCSQKNTLIADMTVMDHLKLAYGLKCAKSDFIAEADELLQLVGLLHFKKIKTKKLSGGQKRKLCLCMALIGDSRVVLLDEPTAGMDVESRQDVELFLESQKGHRTILLTTHYMDEAESLGDRVFIMAGGRVVCSGSTDFLKKRFASGYTLTVLAEGKENNMETIADRLKKRIQKHVKGAEMGEIRGMQIEYILPSGTQEHFAELFEDLETNRKELNLANFGLSVSNLEQVFLKVGNASGDDGKAEDKEDKEERVRELLKEVYEDDHVRGVSLVFTQLAQMFKKKLLYSWNHWFITAFFQISLPALCLLLCALLAHGSLTPTQRWNLDLTDFGSGEIITENHFPDGNGSDFKEAMDVFLKEELKKNGRLEMREFEPGTVEEYAEKKYDDPLPAMAFIYGRIKEEEESRRRGRSVDWNALNAFWNSWNISASGENSTTTTTTSEGLQWSEEVTSGDMDSTETFGNYSETATEEPERAERRKGRKKNTEYVLMMYNARHLYSLPTALNLFGTVKLRREIPEARISMKIRYFERKEDDFHISLLFSLALALLMSAIFSFITEPLAEDVSTGFMHQQLLTGLPVWIYWFVEYIYAFLIYVYQSSLYAASMYFTGLDWINILRVLALCGLLFYCVMPIVAGASVFFKSSNGATTAVGLLLSLGLIGAFVAMTIAMALISMFYAEKEDMTENKESTRRIVEIVFSCLTPSLPFALGLKKVTLEIAEIEGGKRVVHEGELEKHMKSYYTYLIVMAVMGTIYNLLFIVSRIKKVRNWLCGGSNRNKAILEKIPPSNTKTEKSKDEKPILKVTDLGKVFKTKTTLGCIPRQKTAVLAHVSFEVKENECFGLLGVTGAGKTTAFNVITGREVETDGFVEIDGEDVRNGLIIGLCPQFDTLHPGITGRQALKILASIHGYRDVKGVVEKLIEMVGMEEHAGKKRFGKCSGGQKRRLSVAAALLPRKSPFVILDEATAGIDPVARRDVWSVLSVVREHSAILMSSHSMEECEALCSRIAILRNGQIEATGTSQELKSTLGDFYMLSLSLESIQDKPKAVEVVSAAFPGAALQKGSFSRNIRFKIPKKKEDLWSVMFSRCQEVAKELGANDFSLTQPSLQDIFLIVANQTNSAFEEVQSGKKTMVSKKESKISKVSQKTSKSASKSKEPTKKDEESEE